MPPLEKQLFDQFLDYWNIDAKDPVISCPVSGFPESSEGLPDNVVYIFGK